VEIRRSNSGYQDAWRRYKVFVDGEEVGRLSRGDSARFDIEPGSHVVEVGIDWKRSARFTIDGGSDEVFRFRCGPTKDGAITSLINLVKREDDAYLSLVPDDGES
jgi:hypothetical protein